MKKDFIEGINHHDLMCKKHKNICTVLNRIDQLLILASAITGCVSICAFASLDGIPIAIASFAVG